MTWGYRVFLVPASGPLGDDAYVIREVYYDEDDQIEFWSDENIFPVGETLIDLEQDIHTFLEAFSYPVLTIQGDRIFEVEPGNTLENLLEEGEMIVDVELEE